MSLFIYILYPINVELNHFNDYLIKYFVQKIFIDY